VSKKSRRATSKAVVSTLSLLVGASAQAGHYPAANDPGGNGTNIPGFTGQYIFTIDDNCFAQGNGVFSTGNASGDCGVATVYSGNVNLYSFATDTPPNGSVLGTFDLTSEAHDFWQITAVDIEGGQLAGVETGWMGPNPGTGDYYSDDNFWLQFQILSETEILSEIDPAFISLDGGETFSQGGTVIFGPECREVNGVPIDCVVGATPEPGSLGLLFAALGGGWLARRRARKSAEA